MRDEIPSDAPWRDLRAEARPDPCVFQGPDARAAEPLEEPPASDGDVDPVRAWRELVRVHALEQARLLRAAARLRRAFASDRGLFRPARLTAWRRRAQEALELAYADGLEPPARLRFSVAHSIRRWSDADELDRTARELVALRPR